MKTFFKFLLGALSGLVLVILAGFIRFQRQVTEETLELFASADSEDGDVVREVMLAGLPEPVQRYLVYSGIIGKPRVKRVRLKQVGKFRMGVDHPWMDMTADEYYTIDPPGLVWNATFKIAGVPIFRALDRYWDAQGHMQGKLAALIPVVDARGEELTQGTMLRFLNEMIWFPSAFLGENITWQARDEDSADVTFTNGEASVTATMYFDEQGRMTNFVAERYRSIGDEFSLDTWSTPIDEYGEFAGRRLPVRGRGVWNLADGDFTYIESEITQLEYGIPEPY